MILFVYLAACGGPSSSLPPPPDAHATDHDHAGHGAGDADGHEAGAADAHAGHGEHMAKMNQTREALRASLGAAYDAPVPGLDTADAAKGRALFDTHCASCHGAAGKGDGAAGAGLNPPPADFTDAFHARFYSDAGRVQIIRAGSDGTAMVGFQAALGDQGVLDVYAFVRSLR